MASRFGLDGCFQRFLIVFFLLAIGRCVASPPRASQFIETSSKNKVRTSASTSFLENELPTTVATPSFKKATPSFRREAEATDATAIDKSATGHEILNYSQPKFVIPVHRTAWKNDEFAPPNTSSTYLNGKSKNVSVVAKKTISERDINFVEEIAGKPGEGYYITLGIGTPPQLLNLLIDTGSSNFAVAGRDENEVVHHFDRLKSSTLLDLYARVRLRYTQGEWEGDLVSDLVSLLPSSSLATSRTPFTIITSSTKFFLRRAKWQGILGLAYPSLSRPDRNEPNFVDRIVSENQLSSVFGLQLCGSRRFDSTGEDSSAGHLAVGGVDASAFPENILYTPIIREMYYEVVIADIDVEGKSLGVPCGVYNTRRTIVDSGTTNFLLPHSAFNALIDALRSSTTSGFWTPIPPQFWERTQLICIPRGELDFSKFPVVGVSLFNSESDAFRLELRPEQYLRAVSNYGSRGNCYKLSIGPSGQSGDKSGSVLGAVLMEGFYVVFDKSGKRIGWTENKCETASSQAIKSTLYGPHPVSVNISYCKAPAQYAYEISWDVNQSLMIASYVLGGVAIFLLGIIIYLLVEPILCRKVKSEEDTRDRNQNDYEQLD